MKIDSNKVLVNADIETVFDFLSNAENLIHLLPKDNISDFTADQQQCSFKVQGGFNISLVHVNAEKPTILHLKSGEKSPFPFNLSVHLKTVENKTEGYLAFDGQVNMFLKMMVEKPLTNLFNYMSHKLEKYYEAN
jgi:carbon monoxide dehydrogenase subunit G